MTENEARQVIECIEEKLNDNSLVFYTKVEQKALDMAIQALEELQQYRAIGTIEEFNALKDAEEQGRLLPYKIGDKFYEPIEWKNCAAECKISSFTIKKDGDLKIRLSGTYGVFEITTEEIGKTVFFTKEEAEKELAKMKSK